MDGEALLHSMGGAAHIEERSVEKNNVDSYLAREVVSTGLALAVFLDEFHLSLIVSLTGTERFVRHLAFIEAAQ